MMNGYLIFTDYQEIINTCHQFNNWVDISEYLYAAYSDHKERNPRFVHFLLLAQIDMRDMYYVGKYNVPPGCRPLSDERLEDFDNAYIQLCDTISSLKSVQSIQENNPIVKQPTPKGCVTRDHAIALYFKAEANLIERPHGKKSEIVRDYGSHFYNHWTEISQGKNMTVNNVKKAIEILADFPAAKDLALQKLKELENSNPLP